MERQTVWGSKEKSSKVTLKSGRKDSEGILGKGTHMDPQKVSVLNSNIRSRFPVAETGGVLCGDGQEP